MKPLHTFLILVLFTGLSGCKNREASLRDKNSTCPAGELVDSFDEYSNSAAVTIISAAVEKNTLKLRLSYSGGCGEHEFKLLGATMIQKSSPPKRGIMLYHNANGDTCREKIEVDMCFDIRPFAYQKSEIILLLEGYDSPLSYTCTK